MLIEVTSASQFDSEIKGPGLVVVDFFTTWCGPCKKIAPFVESLAIKYTNVKFIKCDAEANQDVSTSRDVRAFPTFQFYVNGSMVDEIKGADPNLLEQKVIMHKVDVNPFAGQGFKLTSDSSAPAMSAREARLKNFGALEGERKPVVPKPAAPSVNDEDEALSKAMQMSLAEEKSKDVKPSASTSEAEDIAAALAEQDSIDQQAHDDEWGDEMVPVPVNQEILEQMIDMGFPDVRARKSIVHGGTLEGALAWIAEHQDDPDIDQAYMVKKSETIPKKQLTEEEKAERVKAIKDKVKQRRAERAQIEKQEEIKREKERRERGQKMDETMEERQRMMRKREAEKAKKEKLDAQRERERLRAELARDKEIRRANKGVLPSVLGVDGYNPSIIQYEANSTSAPAVPSNDANSVPSKRSSESSSTSTNSVPAPIKKISKPSTKPSVAVDITPAQKVDSAIQTISRYRTGGDGGAALKLLITFVRNIVQNPTEEKYRSINTESNAFKTKLAHIVGPLILLKAVGFEKNEEEGKLKYEAGENGMPMLTETLAKLTAAEELYRRQNA